MKEQYPGMRSFQGKFKLKPSPSSRPPVAPPVSMSANHASENYSMNPNAVVCLPPASEDLRLVWTLADQASELDDNEQLIESFNRFPYPTVPEIALLCLRYGLQLDKVKVWFMAQRVKYGISWSPEEIVEVRAKLSQKQEECHFQPLISPKKQTPENSEPPRPSSVPQTPQNSSAGREASKAPHTAPVGRRKPEVQSQTSIACQTWQLNSIKPEVPCPSIDNEPHGSKRSSVLATEPPHSSTAPMSPLEKKPRFSEPSGSSLTVGKYQKASEEEVEILSSESEEEQLQEGDGMNWFQGIAGLSASETGNGMHQQLANLGSEALLNSSFDPFQKLDFSGADLPGLDSPDLGIGQMSVEQSGRMSLPGKMRNMHTAFNVWKFSVTNGQSREGPTIRRQRKTKEQLAILKSFFLRCQWAKSEDYSRLEEITGLSRAEIIQWFGDTRYALKHGHLRWFYEGNPEASPRRMSSLQQGPPNNQVEVRSPTSMSGLSNVDYGPLERYLSIKGHLDEKDLDMLCRESRMNYQQVLDWFLSRTQDAAAEVVVSLSDDEELYG